MILTCVAMAGVCGSVGAIMLYYGNVSSAIAKRKKDDESTSCGL
jgi:hypothetical protein